MIDLITYTQADDVLIVEAWADTEAGVRKGVCRVARTLDVSSESGRRVMDAANQAFQCAWAASSSTGLAYPRGRLRPIALMDSPMGDSLRAFAAVLFPGLDVWA